jgi:hypothetical protein
VQLIRQQPLLRRAARNASKNCTHRAMLPAEQHPSPRPANDKRVQQHSNREDNKVNEKEKRMAEERKNSIIPL